MPLRIKIRAGIIITSWIILFLSLSFAGIINKSVFYLSLSFLLLLLSSVSLYLFVPQIKVGNEIKRGKRGKIYLTFDDGPMEPYTSKILDILKEHNVKATFFVIGRKAKEYPSILKRMKEEGHRIGNHTFNHTILTCLSKKRVIEEIKGCEKVISEITGVKPELFRAPHGFRRLFINRILKKLGYIPITWTKGIWDTSPSSSEELIKRTLKRITDGEIILLHDGNPLSYQTVDILPKIIEEYKKSGLKFSVIDDKL